MRGRQPVVIAEGTAAPLDNGPALLRPTVAGEKRKAAEGEARLANGYTALEETEEEEAEDMEVEEAGEGGERQPTLGERVAALEARQASVCSSWPEFLPASSIGWSSARWIFHFNCQSGQLLLEALAYEVEQCCKLI